MCSQDTHGKRLCSPWGPAALVPTAVSPCCAPSTAIHTAGDTNPPLRGQFWALPNTWFDSEGCCVTYLVPPVLAVATTKVLCAPQGFDRADLSSGHLMKAPEAQICSYPRAGMRCDPWVHRTLRCPEPGKCCLPRDQTLCRTSTI